MKRYEDSQKGLVWRSRSENADVEFEMGLTSIRLTTAVQRALNQADCAAANDRGRSFIAHHCSIAWGVSTGDRRPARCSKRLTMHSSREHIDARRGSRSRISFGELYGGVDDREGQSYIEPRGASAWAALAILDFSLGSRTRCSASLCLLIVRAATVP